MAKGGRQGFILRCVDCKNENYITKKSKQLHPEKQEFTKFCSNCNKQTLHKEKK